MGEVRVKDTTLQGIANAIRSKDGTSADILASTFPQRILGIPSGGGGIEVAQGTFTIATSQYSVEITHGLSAIPNFVYLGVTTDCVIPSNAHSKMFSVVATLLPDRFNKPYTLFSFGTWANNQQHNVVVEIEDGNVIFDEEKIIINQLTPDKEYYAGMKYQWFALYVNPESEV